MLLKMSWNGSDWTQSIEGDTGTSIAHFTTTTTKVLYALTMDGFAVLQVVLEGTSILSLDTRYAPSIAKKQRRKLRNSMIGPICGSVSTYWNPMSREYRMVTSTSSDGDGSQEVLVYRPESSSLTLTNQGRLWSFSRSDMIQMLLDEGLLSPQDVPQEFMERSV